MPVYCSYLQQMQAKIEKLHCYKDLCTEVRQPYSWTAYWMYKCTHAYTERGCSTMQKYEHTSRLKPWMYY